MKIIRSNLIAKLISWNNFDFLCYKQPCPVRVSLFSDLGFLCDNKRLCVISLTTNGKG